MKLESQMVTEGTLGYEAFHYTTGSLTLYPPPLTPYAQLLKYI